MKTPSTLRVLLAIALLTPLTAWSAGGNVALDEFNSPGSDRALQRGARTFINYCMGCHTADYHRYSRMARDIGLSEDFVAGNMVFTTEADGEPTKVGSLMRSGMTMEFGKETFGKAPPNLALIARSRGVDWLYTFLRAFYLDQSRPLGANNYVAAQIGMPHVLADLQGWRKGIYEEQDGKKELVGFEQVTQGKLTADEYDSLVTDLVAFLDYIGDPNRATRHAVGFWVMRASNRQISYDTIFRPRFDLQSSGPNCPVRKGHHGGNRRCRSEQQTG